MPFSDKAYKEILPRISPLKTGVDPVTQLSGVVSRSVLRRGELTLAGFICPFYVLDESLLEEGFGRAVRTIGVGQVEEFPRYQDKVDRLIALYSQVESIFDPICNVRLKIFMGDKGVVNASELRENIDLGVVMTQNLESYRHYLGQRNLDPELLMFSQLTGVYYEVGKGLSDLRSDGEMLDKEMVSFDFKVRVLRMVKDGQGHQKGSDAQYEPMGFALNYGLAGLVCRSIGVDILVGTDKPGSYLNYLYHAFMEPEELLVFVPK